MLQGPGGFLSEVIIMQRRSFVVVVRAGVAADVGAGVHWLARSRDHQAAAATLWSRRSFASGVEFADLVRRATLAANRHNAQPWHFQPTPTGVAIAPDFARSLPVADAHNHHPYTSLGCAAENRMLAVRVVGRSSETAFDPAGAGRIEVAGGRDDAARDALVDAIPDRQCTRSDYDGRALGAADRVRPLGALLRVGDRRVDLLVCYGHAAPIPRSQRRPVRDAIIAA